MKFKLSLAAISDLNSFLNKKYTKTHVVLLNNYYNQRCIKIIRQLFVNYDY